MRTDHLSEAVRIVLSAIDGKINEYKELIADLEREKQKYLQQQATPLEKHVATLGRQKALTIFSEVAVSLSKKNRIIAAIQKMPGKFDSEQLLSTINSDGGEEMTKENFAPTFSRLKDEAYKKVGDKDGRGLYEKT